MSEAPTLERTLAVAEEVLVLLGEQNVEAIVIGAMALAVHGYPRDTAAGP